MTSTIPQGVIGVVRELFESDTSFLRVAAVLPEPIRSRALGNRARMTQDILSILRLVLDAPLPQRFVVNIPLHEGDWQVPTGNFDDVPVVPTVAQLTAAFEHNVDSSDTNCAVCQEVVASGTRLRNCQHVFHRACITQWFGTSSRCPVCRDDVRVQRPAGPLAPNASVAGSH